MYEVQVAFPSMAALRGASAPELALVVLRGLIRTHGEGLAFTPLANLTSDVVNGIDDTIDGRRAAAEAIGWLLSHDLIVEVHQRGANIGGPLAPTRLGREVAAASIGRVGRRLCCSRN